MKFSAAVCTLILALVASAMAADAASAKKQASAKPADPARAAVPLTGEAPDRKSVV